MTDAPSKSPFSSRLLIVADRTRLVPLIQKRYPDLEVSAAPTYMSAIAELAGKPVQAVLCFVDPSVTVLERAVRGLREAAGGDIPVVLCCEPAGETLTRQALQAGASDYLIWPPQADELDRALGLCSVLATSGLERRTPADEMQAVTELAAEMTSAPHRVPRKLAEFVQGGIAATAVEVTVDRTVKRVGAEPAAYVLRQAIQLHGETLGEIAVGPSSTDAYTSEDMNRLRQYADFAAQIISAARKQQYWRQLAMTDALTALPNRRYALSFLKNVLGRAASERFRVTVCMFDIDDFKRYNDEYGHATGDAIIKAMGQLFLRHCRVEDVVARYGGDEFVVVFWDAESPRVAGSEHPDAAMAVMRRFQESLKSHDFGCLGTGGEGRLTISGGLATYPWHASNADDLLACAGKALLEAKHSGKDQIYVIG